MKKEILATNLQKEKANFITNNSDCKLSKMEGFQLQDIAIQWSYYSGKIEGSTFSLIQTESLIKDNIVKQWWIFMKQKITRLMLILC